MKLYEIAYPVDGEEMDVRSYLVMVEETAEKSSLV